MKRLKVGDVFTIETEKGNAYIQIVLSDEDGDLIRVLPGLFLDQPAEISLLVTAKELFFIHFPLKATYKLGIVNLVDNFDLPPDLMIPKQMRSKFVDKDGKLLCWHIVDCDTLQRTVVKELTEEQKKLSPWGSWNDTLLIERLAEGWTLENW